MLADFFLQPETLCESSFLPTCSLRQQSRVLNQSWAANWGCASSNKHMPNVMVLPLAPE